MDRKEKHTFEMSMKWKGEGNIKDRNDLAGLKEGGACAARLLWMCVCGFEGTLLRLVERDTKRTTTIFGATPIFLGRFSVALVKTTKKAQL